MNAKPGAIIERDGQHFRLLTRLERGKGSKGNWWAVPVDEDGEQIGIEIVEVEAFRQLAALVPRLDAGGTFAEWETGEGVEVGAAIREVLIKIHGTVRPSVILRHLEHIDGLGHAPCDAETARRAAQRMEEQAQEPTT